MQCFLVRVGIDTTSGQWNGPIDPFDGRFVYVPIPESRAAPSLARYFDEVRAPLDAMGVVLPDRLAGCPMHLDPDFVHCTYGDVAVRRGRQLATARPGDVVIFYAGLRSVRDQSLIYALIGHLTVEEAVRAIDVTSERYHENAHTRRPNPAASEVILRGTRQGTGRLHRAIPIGSWRNRAYRVEPHLLAAWGGLTVLDGYIQRSAVPPRFLDPARFLRWLDGLNVEWLGVNNP